MPPKRLQISFDTRSPSSGLRDVIVTSAPAFAKSPAARVPTGPVPAVTTILRPFTLPPSACVIFTTAATAVVFEPFESSIIDTRIGPKNALFAAASSCSPAAMSVPPMKIAVFFRSFGPRVKMQPCTRSRTSPSVTPP